MKTKYKTQKGLPRGTKWSGGFTILETIVAIMVLSLSIAGAFSAVGQSFSQATIAKDEVKAYYLAQEAIEIIRNKRDANQLTLINTGSGNWLTGITADAADYCYFGKTCVADPYFFSLGDCWGGWDSCPPLHQDTATYLYSYHSAWPDSAFTRSIQIESVSANEIAITVRVAWRKGLINKEFKIKTYLFNWI